MRPEAYTQQAQQNTNAVPLASELEQHQQNPGSLAGGLGFLHQTNTAYGDANSVTPVYNSNIDQTMRSPKFFGTLHSGSAIAVAAAATVAIAALTKNKDYMLWGGMLTLGLAVGGYLQSR